MLTNDYHDTPNEFDHSLVRIVLLLLSPETQRFELLQLEFKADEATVEDVLAHIPVAVTEPAIKDILYTGICGPDGTPLPHVQGKLLADYCRAAQNYLFVGTPQDATGTESVRFARPILTNEEVEGMVRDFTRVWLNFVF